MIHFFDISCTAKYFLKTPYRVNNSVKKLSKLANKFSRTMISITKEENDKNIFV